ncbi:MAG: TIGR01212 family radical SAM protein [Clostridiales bacterium]|nr:TIGR01212 family radical SAM protein [Clostridiales bacterium]
MERYYSYDRFLKETFGEKIYKICLNGGFTCPNRDGTISRGGCIFCSEGGSGEYAGDANLSITQQLAVGKAQTDRKYHGDKYIAYFQAFTGTYAPVERLRSLYEEAIRPKEIRALAIGTRPDCLTEEIYDLLEDLNRRKPVFLEMGLQTCHDSTAHFLNRGYETEMFTRAAEECARRHIRVTAHLILGLPGESPSMQAETIQYLNALPVGGVKLSMLHIIKNTRLAELYEQNPFPVFTLEEYAGCVISCIELLRKDIVIERITGDGPGHLLIAPRWSLDKRRVLNTIHHQMKLQDARQGRYCNH